MRGPARSVSGHQGANGIRKIDNAILYQGRPAANGPLSRETSCRRAPRATGPLRAKAVCEALGRELLSENVEGARAKLERLVKLGKR